MKYQHPLNWPEGEPRTPPGKKRASSQFKVTPQTALDRLADELRKFRAINVILSANLPARRDSMFYADAATKRINDPAVSLFFKLAGRDISICCDLYMTVYDNISALYIIVKAMRDIERFGGDHLSQKSFTGFVALPPPKDVWSVLGINKQLGENLSIKLRREYVMEAFRERAKEGHSKGHDMSALVEARDDALRQLGVE
jgi:hypothetical protein